MYSPNMKLRGLMLRWLKRVPGDCLMKKPEVEHLAILSLHDGKEGMMLVMLSIEG